MNKIKQLTIWSADKCKSLWQWYKGCFKGKPWYIKTVNGLISLIVMFLLYLGAVDINLFWLFGKSPGWAEISEHKTSQASELYSADGVLLGKYFNENRTPVKFDEVNPVFWRALIDTEDERFYSHWGIDPLGLLGAVKDAATGRGGRGASTITQQLAKNMFRVRTQYSTGLIGKIPGVKILVMKTKEWITALKLELYFSYTKGRREAKNEILAQYANTVDFGNNAFGIKTASKTYFNTTPKELTAEQAAVLVGMLKATTFYNPISHPENSLKRRNVVLDNMRLHGDLTTAQFDSLKNIGIDVSEFNVEDNYDGQAKYFREAVAKYIKKLCADNEALENIDLYNDGLKIYTTLDTRMQKYAEQAAKKQMQQVQRNFNSHWRGQQPWQDEKHQVIANFIEDIAKQQPVYKHLTARFPDNPDSVEYYLNKPHTVKVFDYEKGEVEKEMSTMDSIRYMVSFMHCSFVAMEPQTGHVKAWVGDIDFNHWKYDKVTAQRQPGSTFKLFVYTEAMEQGLTPCDKRRDEYFSMKVWDSKKKEEVTWAPTNANGYFTGDSMPLKIAFAQSINSVAVRLGQEMGIKNIIETAHNMGISSPLDDAPALALGSSDVNLLELANAYCTVANGGKAHKEAIMVTKIVDRNGKEIYVAPTEDEQAISVRSAYLMQQMLLGGLRERGGTSMSLWGYIGKYSDTEFGGKTGTSNNHSDAWFMGVSPNLVVGAWVGGEYRCIHFRTGALGQGSRTALPICGYFLESVFGDPAFQHYHGKFKKPDDADIDRSMYECVYTGGEKRDTLDADSINLDTMTPVDENGNPIGGETPPTDHNNATEPSQNSGTKEINFDEL
ncbi:MAG: transglycosylase domain-containing protein [Prevotellaceae bacterium]|nr:transglycosylase domain-containing protein [Prevotellaceae bacterium]MDO4931748.1 transglycosylase domain-containing protein [Prevotellaceae bacterium]